MKRNIILFLLTILLTTATTSFAQNSDWQRISLNAITSDFIPLGIFASSNGITVTGTDKYIGGQKAYRSTDNGLNWSQVLGISMYSQSINVSKKENWLLTTSEYLGNENIKAIDFSNQWGISGGLNQRFSFNLGFIYPYKDHKFFVQAVDQSVNPITKNLVIVYADQAYEVINSNFTDNVACMDFKNDNVGFYVNRVIPGNNTFEYYLNKTSNGGRSWEMIQLLGIFTNSLVTIKFEWVDEINGFMSCGSKLFSTNDAGNSWNLICDFVFPTNIAGFHFVNSSIGYVPFKDPNYPVTVIRKTTDGGANFYIEMIVPTSTIRSGYLVDGYGNNVFIIKDSSIYKLINSTNVQSEEEAVKSFGLNQNYPNPFNPMTTIEYSLSKNTAVTIKVYDMTGKEVATLANSLIKNAGKHKVLFDGSNFTSGVYFYKLTTNDFISTKRMMLIK